MTACFANTHGFHFSDSQMEGLDHRPNLLEMASSTGVVLAEHPSVCCLSDGLCTCEGPCRLFLPALAPLCSKAASASREMPGLDNPLSSPLASQMSVHRSGYPCLAACLSFCSSLLPPITSPFKVTGKGGQLHRKFSCWKVQSKASLESGDNWGGALFVNLFVGRFVRAPPKLGRRATPTPRRGVRIPAGNLRGNV